MSLSSREMEDLKGLLNILADLKKAGLTGSVVAICFSQRLIQPMKN
jgi:hypothetical protein